MLYAIVALLVIILGGSGGQRGHRPLLLQRTGRILMNIQVSYDENSRMVLSGLSCGYGSDRS